MFYRPEYCCSCGEKIDRVEWKLWASRRFCDLCATDHQLTELLPKVVAGIAVLIGALGVGTYLKSRPSADLPVAKRSLVSQLNPPASSSNTNIKATETRSNQSQPSSPSEIPVSQKPVADADKGKTEQIVRTEPVYFCGAATKKGSPCTRKVKGNVRCWQHQGMPAMVPAEKLLVSR